MMITCRVGDVVYDYNLRHFSDFLCYGVLTPGTIVSFPVMSIIPPQSDRDDWSLLTIPQTALILGLQLAQSPATEAPRRATAK